MIREPMFLSAKGGQSFPVGARKRLAMFRGAVLSSKVYSRGIRQEWARLFGDSEDANVRIVSKHPKHENEDSYRADYFKDMTTSKFCLAPPGWATWTPRVFEAMLMGCIPVVVADGNELPFERLTVGFVNRGACSSAEKKAAWGGNDTKRVGVGR